MAKVHKAHKSTTKYNFQRKKVNTKVLLIVLAVLVVAAIGLKIAYDNYVYGEIAVTAPSNEKLNEIAANWRKIEADTANFTNPYAVTPESTEAAAEGDAAAETPASDGTNGQGGAYLLYTGNPDIDQAYVYVNVGELDTTTQTVETFGEYARATLSQVINGQAHWGHTEMQLQIANANCYITVYDADPAKVDESAMLEVLAAIEAALAAE